MPARRAHRQHSFRIPKAEGKARIFVIFSDQKLAAATVAQQINDLGTPIFSTLDLRVPGKAVSDSSSTRRDFVALGAHRLVRALAGRGSERLQERNCPPLAEPGAGARRYATDTARTCGVFSSAAGARRGAPRRPLLREFSRRRRRNAPLVIGIHGRGSTRENFSRIFRDFSQRVQIAMPQAFMRYGDGFSWFQLTRSQTDAEFAAALDTAEQKLWAAMSEIARGRRMFVTGFSQGGMLSYVLAARHPREIAYAFPISGGAPRALLPRGRAASAPVYALHGASDDLIEVAFARIPPWRSSRKRAPPPSSASLPASDTT